ncbi:MAG TPA: ABC transporter substrate-binding protein [Candidatus Saccharimonadales bacterium]|nr:ABC transporter substrate-binding protein [Candidatus Saccharimonadales bacterium]
MAHFLPSIRVYSRSFAASLLLLLFCVSCARHPDPTTLVMIIESSPANLDPRVSTDAQGQRIDELLFDPLVGKDDNFNLKPAAAESWDLPDPQTYVFHLRRGIRFHDGRPLTARDAKWTLDTMRNGSLITLKGATFKLVDRVETPDDYTLVIHTAEPFAPLLWNLTSGAFGIVPEGSGKDFNRHPVGSGPFKFVSLATDSEVVIERNGDYWGEHAHVARVRFNVVVDTTTRALELRKGSADIAINSLTADIVGTLKRDPNLVVMQEPGTSLQYLAFNLRDPVLKDVRVRQALALAMDRQPVQHYLFGDTVRLADSLLPQQHWAYSGEVAHYPHDPARANALLDSAGYARGPNGVRFRLAMKTSTEETTRLLAATLQQQLREVGIALDIRSFEFATFYSDVVKGNFQLYSLRWVGYSNQDPDIFEDAFHSASFPPKRANRGHYSNPRVDQLIDQGRRITVQRQRQPVYAEVQRILAEELPYINLWYFDNVLVHSARVHDLRLGTAGNYSFLTSVRLE